MVINLPNIISFSRVIIAPFFFYLLVWGGKGAIELGCILYLIASLSDFVDGWLARRYNMVSNWGKFFDPLADKILTSTAFIAFVLLDIVELWMVIVILIRDFGTTFLRVYSDNYGKPLITSKTAKFKTSLQMVFIGIIMILLFLGEPDGIINTYFNIDIEIIKGILKSPTIYFSMLILTILTVWTLIEYFLQTKSLFRFSIKKQNL